MKRISKEQVKKVAELARIELNNEETEHHAEQLEKILDYINQLEKINTDNVPCTMRAIEVINVLRQDLNQKFEESECIMDLAPSRENNFFKVPKIIKD
ncbi:MAG: Asp-tRNA(Asn)/Glu-tRNA(Gln) amidotransferase GatCAB subunit C [Prochlorococcus sp. SP3034]|nr:Asp-tRNA(Asn)/Glu-tRNA(Gln) amidotransferase GatCAB subunit C [Prochlorococcus sp. SP3034]|tara:strand:- start:342 stop:635 length:294 start_codon:yes stop_codon:yes gene_type:complete